MKIETNTTQFEFSHGRRPRGTGHWVFAIGTDPDDRATWRTFFGPFGVCRREAEKVARTRRVPTVHVLP